MSDRLLIAECPRVPDFPLDALATAAPWDSLPALALVLPVDGRKPQQATEVRVCHTGEAMRVCFRCEDRDPWATLTARDARLFTEETVEVFFDPVGDSECYFEFETNPLGALLDIVFRRTRNGYKGDWAWDCDGLAAHVRRTAQGWDAALHLPLAPLGITPVPGSLSRVNFCRIDRPSRDGSLLRELSAWAPLGRDNFHTPVRFGWLLWL